MESQLDVIKEKVHNIENVCNRSSTRKSLSEAIKTMAIKEIFTRAYTVTIRTDNLMKGEQLIQQINENAKFSLPMHHWEDTNHLYLRFAHPDDFDKFTTAMNKSNNEPLTSIGNRIDKDSNKTPVKLTRKPVKIEITNVRENIKLDDIKKAIDAIDRGLAEINELKEGKVIEKTRTRYISMKANAAAFMLIFKNLDGMIITSKSRLFPRVNVRPYMCRDCFSLTVMHQCQGKICNNCGNTDHKVQECKKESKYCTNCKQPGHRAKDSHSRRFIQEVIKEIQKSDIPTEFFSDEAYRSILIKNLNI